MKFSLPSLLLTTLSALTTATPFPSGSTARTDISLSTNGQHCLTDRSANALVTGFGSLLSAYTNATAETLLASDFTDTSQSINWLAGYPLDGPTFASKLAFELGQGSQPAIGFTVLSIDAVTCTTIAFRWAATLAQGLTPVKGINILYASQSKDQWQIKSVFSEFDSGLWKQELCQIGAVPASKCTLLGS